MENATNIAKYKLAQAFGKPNKYYDFKIAKTAALNQQRESADGLKPIALLNETDEEKKQKRRDIADAYYGMVIRLASTVTPKATVHALHKV